MADKKKENEELKAKKQEEKENEVKAETPQEEPPKAEKSEATKSEGLQEKNDKKVYQNVNFFSEIRKDLPEIKPGDIIKVSYRVIEGGKERTQLFEGTIIAIKNSGITKTITVRKTSFGIAVERIFPLNSKLVQKIEIKKHSKVRRAKLYYLRKLKGKAARLKELR